MPRQQHRQQAMMPRPHDDTSPVKSDFRPSFLYLLADDLRSDAVTRTLIDRLPLPGALSFRNAFPSAISCVPSRASIETTSENDLVKSHCEALFLLFRSQL